MPPPALNTPVQMTETEAQPSIRRNVVNCATCSTVICTEKIRQHLHVTHKLKGSSLHEQEELSKKTARVVLLARPLNRGEKIEAVIIDCIPLQDDAGEEEESLIKQLRYMLRQPDFKGKIPLNIFLILDNYIDVSLKSIMLIVSPHSVR